jgi:AraC-like DNA-binding protein
MDRRVFSSLRSDDYLRLRMVNLKAPGKWPCRGHGLFFVLPTKGRGIFVSKTDSGPLSPGDLLVLDGSSRCKVLADEAHEITFCFFSVSFERLLPLFATEELALLRNLMEAFSSARFYEAASGLAAECHRLVSDAPTQIDLDHRCQLLRVAASVLNTKFRSARAERAASFSLQGHFAAVLDKLTPAEMMDIPIPELARKFGCTDRHLNRLFHQHFGFSAKGLRIEMRLLKAAALLRDRQLTVGDVAARSGFRHHGLFHARFRRRFGLSPGEWREQGKPSISRLIRTVMRKFT